MKRLMCCLVLFLIFGCTWTRPRYVDNEKEKLSNMVLKEAAQQIRKDLDLICCGTGGEAYHQIKMLGLSLNCHRPVDIDNGRRLVVNATQTLIDIMNAKENLRQYLDHYPVDAGMIWMQIVVQGKNGESLGSESLSFVTADQGIIKYKVEEAGEPYLRIVFQETYEEALEKLCVQEDSGAISLL